MRPDPRRPPVVAASGAAAVAGNRAGRAVTQPSRPAGRKPAPGGTPRPAERRGTAATGRLVKLMIGQGHGFIRLASGREVYFHRSDLEESTAFNDFAIGDAVTFELLEDPVSGARALRVKPRRRSR